MSVWFAIPSARPAEEAERSLCVWRRMGYKIALLRQGEEIPADILVRTDVYRGWAPSVNALVRSILIMDHKAEWIVTGGDDTLPDLNHAPAEIAEQCNAHFEYVNGMPTGMQGWGVMQPTGDPWADSKGRIIERIAGSPWLGRAWCERAYGGGGPMFPYYHNWADEELQNVAIKLGVFWQRPDLTHQHNHWARSGHANLAPSFAGTIHRDYSEGRPLFEKRKAAGWPGSEPL